MIMPEAKQSAEPVPLVGNDADSSPDFKAIYKDWQAIRIIRDNYFDGWRMFYTFYFWFGATMVGATGYIILNRPFQKEDAYFAGFIGSVMIFTVLVFSVLLYFHSKRHVKNLKLILERTGDAAFLGDKMLSDRGAMIMAAGASIGLTSGLAAWAYILFFYYVNRI
jgi:hypothetical protein